MKQDIIVGLFGVALESVNYGCSALAYAQLKVLQDISNELDIRMQYWLFSDDSNEIIEQVKNYLKIDDLKSKYIVRIKTGLHGYKRLKQDIGSCDIIIDLTYGDSFSDIYGKKNFFLYSLPKITAIKNSKPLILGPQTIGPFYNKAVCMVAQYIMRRCNALVVRDEKSLECARALINRRDILVTSDLAMNLPYNKENYDIKGQGKLNVGLNISLLLWNNNSAGSNIKLKCNYQELIYSLLQKLNEFGAITHLIAHVYDDGYSEYDLAHDLAKGFENIIVAPHFKTPIDAKDYISNMDVFIGARMHATIAAFSSGVPVIPISYSRKFEGLYEVLGYKHCVNCVSLTTSDALSEIMDKINRLGELEADRKVAFEKALEMNKAYSEVLTNIIQIISSEAD